MRKNTTLVAGILMMITITLFACAIWYQSFLQKTVNVSEKQIFTIKYHDSFKKIIQNLQKQKIINNPLPLIIYTKLHKKTRIKAGDYLINPSTTYQQLIHNILNGRRFYYKLTVVEGSTFDKVLEQINSRPELTKVLTGKSKEEIAKILGIKGSMEGRFLPETYVFDSQTTDLMLLKKMNQDMINYFSSVWHNRPKDFIFSSPYKALILASLIEKETSKDKERDKISGVFTRRLQKAIRLQTDPSLIYGIYQKNGEKVTSLNKNQLKEDSPYNSYTRFGLPPTPIALPGKASIYAAINPDKSDYLYFVSDGKGGHIFSNEYQDHQKAVQEYRKNQKK